MHNSTLSTYAILQKNRYTAANICPDISISMIERTLKEMLDHGEIIKVGSGREVGS